MGVQHGATPVYFLNNHAQFWPCRIYETDEDGDETWLAEIELVIRDTKYAIVIQELCLGMAQVFIQVPGSGQSTTLHRSRCWIEPQRRHYTPISSI